MFKTHSPGWLITLLLLPLAASAEEAATVAVEVEAIQGELPASLEQNIRAHLAIERLSGEPAPMSSRLQYLHRQAQEQIEAALQPYGYYQPRVESELTKTPEQWVARYRVDPGEPVRLDAVDLNVTGEAQSDPVMKALESSETLVPGAVLEHAAYEAHKSRMRSLAAERGYYEADFGRQQLRIDPQRRQADIELRLDSGPRYRIGEVRFGESPVETSLLQRYQPFQTGDPVTSTRLLDLQRYLVESEYFSRVEVQPLWDEAVDHVVPVDVALEPNKRTAYKFGVGYGTDTGARMSARQHRRWVNRYGHSWDALLRLSEVDSTVVLQYNIPGEVPYTDKYGVRASWESEQTDTTDSELTAIGGFWQKQLGAWQQILALDWEQERFVLDGEQSETNFLIPGASWSTTHTDNPLNPSRGYRFSLELKAASDALLSDADFVQGLVSAKHVLTLTDRLRLLSRADVGATAMENFDIMPSSHRFFAGGDSSVRGYGYKELGPEGDNGDVVGGRNLLVASAEVDYLVADSWRVAAFYDTGNAIDSATEALKNGAGLGVRYLSPIGPIRLDLAVPLDDDGFRIHFTLGPDL
ncbi:autotransporter assembly complex protein TamA [Marinobacterium nitratireducens]|uniref:autotransporter assembly complex protein TamA n=1 Tax=Marinobacterium nitratireducens TaxID=518897 RepID=UPI001E56D6FF|nr:autotransporter assembly complex family protein [Marinobacterium nitratireducens]